MLSLGRALSRIVSLAAWIGMICVGLMMVHVTADVVGRYVFNAPIGGTITIVSNYYMVVLGFVALAVAEEKDAHISVEVVADLMPPMMNRPLNALAALLAVGVFGLLTVRTWAEAGAKQGIGAALQQGSMTIPIWPSYYALPIGCGLMTVVALYKLIVHVTGRPSGLEVERPAAPGDDIPPLERLYD